MKWKQSSYTPTTSVDNLTQQQQKEKQNNDRALQLYNTSNNGRFSIV